VKICWQPNRALSDDTLSHEILESTRDVLSQLVSRNTHAKAVGKPFLR
jgi:hypothetical protein